MPLRQIKDALLINRIVLPDEDAEVLSADFDLGQGEKLEKVELHVALPDLSLAELPDAKSLTVRVLHGDAPAPTDELAVIGSVTAAAPDATAARTIRYRYPPTVGRYVRVAIAGEAGVAASGKEAEASLVF